MTQHPGPEQPGAGPRPEGEQPSGQGGPGAAEQPPQPAAAPEQASSPVAGSADAERPDAESVDAEPVDDVTADAEPVGQAAGEADVAEGEVVEGEIVEPVTSQEAVADALLAEALDADAIEAQFSAAEAQAQAAAAQGATVGQVASLTADLQRVHAEYSNYRKRVERDRRLMQDKAVEDTLVGLLPILDDIGRARAHGDLLGAFKAVGEALEAAVAKHGLTPFGQSGEPFDPTRHEALMREEREGVTEPTVVTVLQVGYEMNGRIVRPARVSVAGAY